MDTVLQQVQRSLPDGAHRVAGSRCDLSTVCRLLNVQASDQEQTLLDFGFYCNNPTSSEFEEEVAAIAQALASGSDGRSLQEVELSDGKQAALTVARDRMARRSLAVAIWTQYAIPVRLRDQRIYCLFAPHALFGTPVVRSYPANTFVAHMTIKVAELGALLARSKRTLLYWQITSIVLLAALFWTLQ